MNHWQVEFLVECHRQQILQEVEQIRLESHALKSRADHPQFLERAMFNVGNWMASTGSQLRKRYKNSLMDCKKPSTNSF